MGIVKQVKQSTNLAFGCEVYKEYSFQYEMSLKNGLFPAHHDEYMEYIMSIYFIKTLGDVRAIL